jgi:quinoprotein glucose dehydrogenase
MKQPVLSAALVFLTACSQDEFLQDASLNTDWETYLGDPGRSHYSELSQITRENVSELELAWSYNSGELREGNSTMYTSPLIVDGILYGLSPKLVAFALNAATGEEQWRYDPGGQGVAQRGLMWWEGNGETRLFYVAGRELIALDPLTGQPITAFGINGRLDLTPTEKTGPLFTSVPGIVFEDKLIMGFSTSERATSHAGMIRAFSVLDGTEIWRFNSLPLTAGLGSETWEEGSLTLTGGER